MERFVCFLAFMKKSAVDGADLLGEFQCFLNEGPEDRICQDLITEYRERIESEVECR